MQKECTRCGEIKPLDDFVRRTDGGTYTSHCKPCRRVSVTAWRLANPDKVREQERRRDERSRELFGVSRSVMHDRANPEQARARNVRHMASLRAEQPERLKVLYQAAGAVRTALRRGSLVRPDRCERCGQQRSISAAHWSYAPDDWLDVRWLCRPCHASWDHSNPKLFSP
jgi:hypothetical protein